MSDISAEGQAPPPSDTKTQTRKLLWIVLALILLSRLVMWGMLKDPPGAFIEVDSHSYLDPAEALWQDGRYHIEPGSEVPETLRPPGYPLFLATVFALAGNSTHAIVFFQIALFLATCYLLYNFGERWFGPRPALWAVIFLAIDPPSLSYNFKIMSECLTAFLTLAFAWAVYRYFETRGRSRFGFLSGMFLTLATLVRPTTYYFLPVLLMVFLGFLIREKVDWKGTVRSLVITALPFIILIGGWQWRNLEKVGVFQFTTVKGWALYLGKGAQIYGDLHRVGLGEAEVALIQILKQKIPEWDSLPMERKDAIFLAEGKKLVKEHPWPAVKTHFEQMFYFFFGPGTTSAFFRMFDPDFKIQSFQWFEKGKYFRNLWNEHPAFLAWLVLGAAYLAGLYVFLAAWIFSGGREAGTVSREGLHFTFLLLIVYIAAASSINYGQDRYRVVVMPLLCLYAGAGVPVLLKLLSSGRLRWRGHAGKPVTSKAPDPPQA